jgi:hypothetical protein
VKVEWKQPFTLVGWHNPRPLDVTAVTRAEVPVGPAPTLPDRAAFLTLRFQFSKVRCTDRVLGGIVGARSFDLDALAPVVANGNPNGL